MTSRKFSLVVNQVLFVLLAYTLLQGHLFLRQRQEMNPRTRGRLLQLLNPTWKSWPFIISSDSVCCLLGSSPRSYWNWRSKRAKLLPKMKKRSNAISIICCRMPGHRKRMARQEAASGNRELPCGGMAFFG